MAEMERPIEEEFAVVVAALLAGRIDGQQAVQSSAALHRRVSLSWLASVLADDATVEVVAGALAGYTWLSDQAATDALAALSAHLTAPVRAGDTSGEEAGRG